MLQESSTVHFKSMMNWLGDDIIEPLRFYPYAKILIRPYRRSKPCTCGLTAVYNVVEDKKNQVLFDYTHCVNSFYVIRSGFKKCFKNHKLFKRHALYLQAFKKSYLLL